MLIFQDVKYERKEMFYLLKHSAFYFWLCGIRHMVKDHSDSKRVNLLPPLHGVPFPMSSKSGSVGTSSLLKCEVGPCYFYL